LLAVVKGVIKIEATVDIDPNTLNLNSHGKWITCYVALPEGYDVNSVDPTTIALNDIIYPDRTHIEDYDGDGVQDLMVKFSRDLVCAVLEPAEEVTLTVSGKITERVYFEGTDTIRVIDKGKQKGKEKGHRNGPADSGSTVTEGSGLLAECFVYYFHLDHLGTPQVMTDDQGEVVWQADYLPFGQADVVGTVENSFRFPGQYLDAETGLYYNYFRYYNPGTGRYVTPDPIGLAGGINLYLYVANDPINLIDPYGLINYTRTMVGLGEASVGALMFYAATSHTGKHCHCRWVERSSNGVGRCSSTDDLAWYNRNSGGNLTK
jgi:RHS repeat-associated protein